MSDIRLTLRTLLAYLDDMLEPSQAKVIGQKIADSETAQQLIEKIRHVTRRRRLAPPGAEGAGSIDPNTIAEYLDNEVTAEQAAEVEEICLGSDAHLAEVAACHQILTLVLGEPATVSPAAKQRMYKLVKGPESIHNRKPPSGPKPQDQDLSSEIMPENLGLAHALGGWRNGLIMLGGGVIAVGLLAFALWNLLKSGSTDVPDAKDQVVQRDAKKDTSDSNKVQPPPKDTEKKDETIKKDKEPEPKKDKEIEVPPPPVNLDIPWALPDARKVAVGKWTEFLREPAVLLQRDGDPGAWKLATSGADVQANRPLLSLPGMKNTVNLASGVDATLWGYTYFQSKFRTTETVAIFHKHDQLDVDVTLKRGRLLLSNNQDKLARVRLRFDDPRRTGTEANKSYIDIELREKGSAVVIEMLRHFELGEPFYLNREDERRVGPTVVVDCIAYAGTVFVRIGDVGSALHPTQGNNRMGWHTSRALLPARTEPAPPGLFAPPVLTNDLEKKLAGANQVAVESLAMKARKRTAALDVLFVEMIQAKESTPRTLAVDCYAALDDLASIWDAYVHESATSDVRTMCRMALHRWIANERDNDYRLHEFLSSRYTKKAEPIKIMELLHLFSAEQARDRATLEHLVEGLNNNLLPIRDLSAWHLYSLHPAGGAIAYAPDASPDVRESAQRAWHAYLAKEVFKAKPAGK